MRLFIHLRLASGLVWPDPDVAAANLHRATVVLQHADGSVGFDRRAGVEAIRALVGDAFVVERANSPRWFHLPADAQSSSALHAQFSRVTTLSVPLPGVIQELETVSSNKRLAQKNAILARHGKPLVSLESTVFDDWVAPSGLYRERPVAGLIGSCQAFVVWSFSNWGLYASVLGRSAEEALAAALLASKVLSVPTTVVQSESELPSW